jgi:hypothetical protein
MFPVAVVKPSAIDVLAPRIQNPTQEPFNLPPFFSVPSSGETSSIVVGVKAIAEAPKNLQEAGEPTPSLIQALRGSVQRGVSTRSMSRRVSIVPLLESSTLYPLFSHTLSPLKKLDSVERGIKRRDLSQLSEGPRKRRKK